MMKILPLKYLVFVILLTSALLGYSAAYSTYVSHQTTTAVDANADQHTSTDADTVLPSSPEPDAGDADDQQDSSQQTESVDQQESTDTKMTNPDNQDPRKQQTNDQDAHKDIDRDQDAIQKDDLDRADLNCDGRIDEMDLEIVLGYYKRPYTPLVRSPDINGDGIVAQADLGELLAVYGKCDPNCPADFNADGAVDDCDLSIIKAYYKQPFTGMQSPDFNNDGWVDQHDLGEILAAFP
jgi:hypothetical protein